MQLASLDRLLDRLQHQPQWQQSKPFFALCRHWPQTVGLSVAQHTRPTAVREGTLYVAVSSSAWAQNLAFERRNLLTKLQNHPAFVFVPPLSEIRFSTARWNDCAPSRRLRQGLQSQRTVQRDRVNSLPSQDYGSPNAAGEIAQPASTRTAMEAFTRWSERVAERDRGSPHCPHCDRPTPQVELDRWRVCGMCAIARWSHCQAADSQALKKSAPR